MGAPRPSVARVSFGAWGSRTPRMTADPGVRARGRWAGGGEAPARTPSRRGRGYGGDSPRQGAYPPPASGARAPARSRNARGSRRARAMIADAHAGPREAFAPRRRARALLLRAAPRPAKSRSERESRRGAAMIADARAA